MTTKTGPDHTRRVQMTDNQKLVLDVLLSKKLPMSPSSIMNRLRGKHKVAIETVRAALTALLDLGMVEKMRVHEKTFWRVAGVDTPAPLPSRERETYAETPKQAVELAKLYGDHRYAA